MGSLQKFSFLLEEQMFISSWQHLGHTACDNGFTPSTPRLWLESLKNDFTVRGTEKKL